jgi:hypothetical protein
MLLPEEDTVIKTAFVNVKVYVGLSGLPANVLPYLLAVFTSLVHTGLEGALLIKKLGIVIARAIVEEVIVEAGELGAKNVADVDKNVELVGGRIYSVVNEKRRGSSDIGTELLKVIAS